MRLRPAHLVSHAILVLGAVAMLLQGPIADVVPNEQATESMWDAESFGVGVARHAMLAMKNATALESVLATANRVEVPLPPLRDYAAHSPH